MLEAQQPWNQPPYHNPDRWEKGLPEVKNRAVILPGSMRYDKTINAFLRWVSPVDKRICAAYVRAFFEGRVQGDAQYRGLLYYYDKLLAEGREKPLGEFGYHESPKWLYQGGGVRLNAWTRALDDEYGPELAEKIRQTRRREGRL